MIVEKITLEGFKSFKDKEVINFKGNNNGLFFLTGENRVEPSLGANAVGKSTIFDALCFVNFGKTSRGLRAGDIGTWNSKKTLSVVESILINDKKIHIKRTWNPNSLLWCFGEVEGNWTEVSQEKLEETIGFSFDSFSNSMLVSQTGEMFLDMTASTKTSLFSTVLGLDDWLVRSKKAQTAVDDLLGWINDLEKDLIESAGKISELLSVNYKAKSKDWLSIRKEKLSVLRNKKFSAEREIQINKANALQAEKKFQDLLQAYDKAREKAKQGATLYRELLTEFYQIEKTLTSLVSNKNMLLKEVKRLEDNFSEGVCPLCQGEISEEHLDKEFSRLEKEILSLKEEEAGVRRDLKKAQDVQKAAFEEAEALNKASDVCRDKKDAAGLVKSRLNQELVYLGKDIKRLSSEIEDLEKSEDPFLKEEEERNLRVAQLKKGVKEFEKELEALRRTKTSVEFWIKGFKEVRMMLVEEALSQLEIEVNTSLHSLGLLGWRIFFAMDEETKSGGIHKGFSVFVQSPYNDKKVRWESWSGGESQRLRVAGTMGLINLILNRRGIPTNLEIWDEPSNFLSEQGIADLLDTLSARSLELGKQIWVVDHRALAYPNFESTYTVVKEESGSSLKVGFYQ